MNALCFVDTNVLVYSRDRSEPDKQPRAHQWLTALWHHRSGRTSVQVLSEYYVTVTRKLDPGLREEEAWADIEALLAWRPLPVDAALVRRARTASQHFALSWWDALVVAAAQAGNCAFLLTEDLPDGQNMDGPRVIDPFQHRPEELPAPAQSPRPSRLRAPVQHRIADCAFPNSDGTSPNHLSPSRTRVRQSLRDKPVVAPMHGVDTGVAFEGVDVCEQGIQEVVAQSHRLAIVEPEAVDEVLLGLIKDLDPHLTESRMFAFASPQSTYSDVPSLTRPSRARSTSACHAGGGRSLAERHRSSQISSSARSLSEVVIWSNGSATSIVSPISYLAAGRPVRSDFSLPHPSSRTNASRLSTTMARRSKPSSSGRPRR